MQVWFEGKIFRQKKRIELMLPKGLKEIRKSLTNVRVKSVALLQEKKHPY